MKGETDFPSRFRWGEEGAANPQEIETIPYSPEDKEKKGETVQRRLSCLDRWGSFSSLGVFGKKQEKATNSNHDSMETETVTPTGMRVPSQYGCAKDLYIEPRLARGGGKTEKVGSGQARTHPEHRLRTDTSSRMQDSTKSFGMGGWGRGNSQSGRFDTG